VSGFNEAPPQTDECRRTFVNPDPAKIEPIECDASVADHEQRIPDGRDLVERIPFNGDEVGFEAGLHNAN